MVPLWEAAARTAAGTHGSRALDPHKVRGELSVRRLVLAGREERMALKPSRQLFIICNS